jgi:ABC-type branched-subunit amino acid transport system ATPase component
MPTADPILVVDDVVRIFGGVRAVDGCSFTVARGSITGLIGPIGAGKSTMVNLIAGALRPDAGTIGFDGRDITDLAPHKVAELGLIRTFQISREYPAMTVMENLMVSPRHKVGEGLVTALSAPRRYRRQELELVARAQEILASFELERMRDEHAGNLSGGPEAPARAGPRRHGRAEDADPG